MRVTKITPRICLIAAVALAVCYAAGPIIAAVFRYPDLRGRSNQHSKFNNHQSSIKPIKVAAERRATLEDGEATVPRSLPR